MVGIGRASPVTPATGVAGIVGEEVTPAASGQADSPVCTQMPLFASREVGERSLADHPGVAVVGLDEAREVARAYVQTC